MKLSKRISLVIISALVALSSSVFLVGPKVYAQTTTTDKVEQSEEVPKLEPVPVKLDALRENEPVLKQSSQIVEEKSTQLKKVSEEKQSVEVKKQTLSQDVEANKHEIEVLRQKVAEKKAREEAERQRIAEEERQAEAERVEAERQAAQARQYSVQSYSTATTTRYVTSGNWYDPGQCTWHVKNLKPELPNNLGNADQWYWNAQADGLATGLVARPGAAASHKVGQHVVYVLEVYANGTMLVSEMNYDYVAYHQRTAIKNQADFYYIY